MNIDLFLNLAKIVVRLVLADASRDAGAMHSSVEVDNPWDHAPYVSLGGTDSYLSVTLYDRHLSTWATRYGSANHRPEVTCLDVSLLVEAA